MSSIPLLLFQSLIQGPRLIGDLPEADTFAHQSLEIPARDQPLNFEQNLGRLYEDVLAVMLESSSKYDLVLRNLQLHDPRGNTIGELDFVIREAATGQLIHLELATKFYLAVVDENGLALPGPDARDNYFRKLRRLREHQLTLSQTYPDALPEPFRGLSADVQQLVYGCLFDHVHAPKRVTPEFVEPNCRRGRWLTIDECSSYFANNTYFRIIPKPLWPVPLDLLRSVSLETWNPSAPVERCIMLRVNEDPFPYFITPSGYPNHIVQP